MYPEKSNNGGAARVSKILTIIGLACCVIMLAGMFHWRLPSFGDKAPAAPLPEPDIEITGTVGSLDEIGIVRYYSHEKYPDGPPVGIGDEIEYGGKTYVLRYVTDGLVSTWEGDCWEVQYRLPKDK